MALVSPSLGSHSQLSIPDLEKNFTLKFYQNFHNFAFQNGLQFHISLQFHNFTAAEKDHNFTSAAKNETSFFISPADGCPSSPPEATWKKNFFLKSCPKKRDCNLVSHFVVRLYKESFSLLCHPNIPAQHPKLYHNCHECH